MKTTKLFSAASFLCGSVLLASTAFVACSSGNDEPGKDPDEEIVDSKNLDYTASNAKSWHNYSVKVAELLAKDSKSLLDAWTKSYNGGASFADIFRNANGNGYTSYVNCVEEIISGCVDIANEVGEAKIGDPYQLYVSGDKEAALYAVESWYSWHSREDYSNNILSIRNSYFGSLDGSENANSLATLVKTEDAALDSKVRGCITAAYDAILAIPQPFRNNINSKEAVAAMDACAELNDVLDKELKSMVTALGENYDAQLEKIVKNYVDNVVIPTYEDLNNKNNALLSAVRTLASTPNDANFEAACAAWLNARKPWETSEAFLFGPVDALGLDPNMDSWPLDQDAIVKHLNSGSFDDLDWSGDFDEDDDKIQAAQNIRGFHTLEFLLFKNGEPRKVSK